MPRPISNGQAFRSREIDIGGLKLGGRQPVLVQSMTTTNTMDVEKTVEQALDLEKVGCQLVRITAPTIKDAEALREIREALDKRGSSLRLVADIHFQPKAAMIAADYVDKVRINPGNFADRKMFKSREYTDDEYSAELERIREKFEPLVQKLKERSGALRIGTNHGSLSDRIMNQFGDTPQGMVESAFEYAQICRDNDFHNFCFSMKASNVRVMVEAYRLLVDEQIKRSWDYPVHLGVTEAGDGEDARLKSFIGIGSLLAEGIGDTVRVSLTEASVNEVPVARLLAERFSSEDQIVPRSYAATKWEEPLESPRVWSDIDAVEAYAQSSERPDTLYLGDWSGSSKALQTKKEELRFRLRAPELKVAVSYREDWKDFSDVVDFFVYENYPDKPEMKNWVMFSEGLFELKQMSNFDPNHIVLRGSFEQETDQSLLELSLQLGVPYVDLPFQGIFVQTSLAETSMRLAYGVLQATRRRMSKTEYIACPSCGRTLFDLEETTARIKEVTGHLKDVKIAVMGCIVNGPGEMADADFGYVGGAPGKVNLYVKKDCVERNIASAEAPQRLVELIKRYDKWTEPSSA